MRGKLKDAKRIVIKVGTNVLANDKGLIDEAIMKKLIDQIAIIKNKGKDIVIVTSGAIGSGMAQLGLEKRPRDVNIKQACAAVGQANLMSIYNKYFSKYSIKTAQLLLTYDAFSNRKTFLNLKNCMEELLKLGAIPIINENDPLSIDEIGPSFGDNDRLSALVASKIEAELLIILTTVDGLYDIDPSIDKGAKMIKEVAEIDNRIMSMGGKSKNLGLGGMATKIEAAKIATSAGIPVIIANGRSDDNIIKVIDGQDVGTVFYTSEKISGKKRWITQSKSKGTITIDEGALKAIKNGKNLLPAGIKEVSGNFGMNDVVEVYCGSKVCAKAIVDYSSDELKKVKGKKSSEIESMGQESRNVMKRENLVIL